MNASLLKRIPVTERIKLEIPRRRHQPDQLRHVQRADHGHHQFDLRPHSQHHHQRFAQDSGRRKDSFLSPEWDMSPDLSSEVGRASARARHSCLAMAGGPEGAPAGRGLKAAPPRQARRPVPLWLHHDLRLRRPAVSLSGEAVDSFSRSGREPDSRRARAFSSTPRCLRLLLPPAPAACATVRVRSCSARRSLTGGPFKRARSSISASTFSVPATRWPPRSSPLWAAARNWSPRPASAWSSLWRPIRIRSSASPCDS